MVESRLSLLFLLSCCVFATAVAVDTDFGEWDSFKQRFGRRFGSASEDAARFAVFRANLRAAEALSASSQGARWGVTKFMDLTPAEFSASHGLLLSPTVPIRAAKEKSAANHRFNKAAASAGTNWLARGLVTRVHDQHEGSNCHSCWSFASAAGAEGCFAIRHNSTRDLSPQMIIDCSGAGNGPGHGGLPNKALHWAVTHDLATWESYAYLHEKGRCRNASEWSVGLAAGTCEYHKVAMHEDAVHEALTHNVVPILVAAAPLHYYIGGVINGSACKHVLVDHAVLVVADTDNVWTVKNSWGADWGEQGYFRMEQGVDCLLMASDASVAY